MTTAGTIFLNVALAYSNIHMYDDAVRYARRSIEVSRSGTSSQPQLGAALSVLANALRYSGDLEGARQAIRESVSVLEKAEYSSERNRKSTLFSALWREGVILGQHDEISLERPDDAIPILQRAFDVGEDLSKRDPNDSSSRILEATAARELGAILHDRSPLSALAIYDQAILRLREVKNNTKARREEARLLAGSSYALRRLSRIGESRERTDAALQLLGDTKDYPAERIEPGSEVCVALRALADHLADTNQPRRAGDVYQDLLDRIMAWKPDPRNDLPHAVKLCSIYESLAGLRRRTGRSDQAAALSALRLEIWRHWDGKLPNNAFVHRRLVAASSM